MAPAAVAVVLDDELVQQRLRVGAVRGEVLVRRSLVAPAPTRSHEPRHGVLRIAPMAQEVGVGRQADERPVALEGHVGVDEQQVVGAVSRELEQLAAVVAEVVPRPVVQFARKSRQDPFDDLGRAVARPGIADRPRVDQRKHRAQAALDHRGLVANDHREPDPRALCARERRDVVDRHRRRRDERRALRQPVVGTATLRPLPMLARRREVDAEQLRKPPTLAHAPVILAERLCARNGAPAGGARVGTLSRRADPCATVSEPDD